LVPSLDRVVAAAASTAVAVDRDAAFPTATVDAAREAGLLGIISASDVGGHGLGIGAACHVVEAIARVCPTSAMVMCMHYAGTAVVEKAGSEPVRREIAAGRHLSTLAFSEAGSRSHFWAPTSTASAAAGGASLDARKSWITSASHADAYVWSSRPLAAEGMSTLWLVPRGAPGLEVLGSYDGLGLRGNDSAPVAANGVVVPASAMLGADGGGFDMMMGVVLPIFALMNAGCSVGIMEGAVNAAAGHVAATRYAHLGSSLADLPTIRAYLARAKVRADQCRTLWADAIAAVEGGRADGMLRVLEAKAAAGEGALEVTATCMRVCGGAAYRKEVGVERLFRDAQAASVMAPTTDQLYDFIGKALTGLPLFG
jgi:alkylation response protein AidB-like acyl-CoA dehydrogenase